MIGQRLAYPERLRDDSPLPPPTKENWLAGGVHLVAAALALLSFPIVHLVGIFGCLYGVGLALGVWFVRPRKRHRRAFTLLLIPLLIQAAVYALYWYPIAAAAVSGEGAGGVLDSPSPAQQAAFQASLSALVLGWIPSMFLRPVGRQTGLLVIVQFAAPGLAVLFYVLNWVGV